MADQKSQPAPVSTPAAAKAPAANPPAAQANALVIDERFAQLAAQFMAQVNASIEALRQEFATQMGTNVDPLHKDLHDLLDAQTALGGRLDKIEAIQPAPGARLDDLQKLIESIPDQMAEALAAKLPAPVLQQTIAVTDRSIEDRLTKIESKLRFF